MSHIKIKRTYRDKSTTGLAWVENEIGLPEVEFKTLELPWKDNKPRVSCIPEGVYKWQKYNSPKFGEVILILGVDGRSMIEIHAGNFTSDILGCILPGSEHSDINSDGILDVIESRKTLRKILSKTKNTGLITIS
jgi:hypothetical protein